jgi:hypothetical protein
MPPIEFGFVIPAQLRKGMPRDTSHKVIRAGLDTLTLRTR